jgi:hypothetical protein
MDPATTASPGLALSTQTAGGITIVKLSGELDIACVPALRERLLGMLRPSATRLIVDFVQGLHLACLAALGQPGDDAVAAVFGDAQARPMPRSHILGSVKFAAEFWKRVASFQMWA